MIGEGEEKSTSTIRWEDLHGRISQLEKQLDVNTKATARVEANTAELVDILNSWKGAMKVIDFLGKLSKPIGWVILVASAFVAIWYSIFPKR